MVHHCYSVKVIISNNLRTSELVAIYNPINSTFLVEYRNQETTKIYMYNYELKNTYNCFLNIVDFNLSMPCSVGDKTILDFNISYDISMPFRSNETDIESDSELKRVMEFCEDKSNNFTNQIVYIDRGTCTFVDKVRNAVVTGEIIIRNLEQKV